MLALIVAGILYVLIGKKTNYRGIYLVPADANYIIKVNNPAQALHQIRETNIWPYLTENKKIGSLNTQLLSIDSLLNKNRFLLNTLVSRTIILSNHPAGYGKTGFLLIADVNTPGNAKNIVKLTKRLRVKGFTIRQRTYKDTEIFELFDTKHSRFYYTSLVKNKLVVSLSHVLVEKVIDQQHQLAIGKDLQFIEVSKYIENKGLFNLFIPAGNFTDELENVFTNNQLIRDISRQLHYFGLYLDVDKNNKVHVQASASVNDTINSLAMVLTQAGQGTSESIKVVPVQSAAFASVCFNNFSDLYDRLIATMPNNERIQFEKELKKINNLLGIDIRKNLVDIMDNELAFLYTQPANYGQHNEMAVILKAKKANELQQNFNYINQQIYEYTPAKIKDITYHGYSIHYLSFSGIIKTLFSRSIKKMEKPYYTIIDKYVIFSNHPQTLKTIIDSYNAGTTLHSSPRFYNFNKNFGYKYNAFLYIHTPLLYNNLANILDTGAYATFQQNKAYFMCFPNIGISLRNTSGVLQLSMVAGFNELVGNTNPTIYGRADQHNTLTVSTNERTLADTISWENNIVITDLDAAKQSDYYDNGALKYQVELKNGLKHGSYKVYYANGMVKIKGRFKKGEMKGAWQYFNSNGELIKREDFQ